MNKQAEELNEIIKRNNQVIYNLFSEKGKEIFFPKEGILSQAAEAKGKKINATVGSAIEDDGTPMRLGSIAKNVLLDPKNVFPYAPSYGKPELRKLWKERIKKKNPSLKGEISLPVVTNALTHGLSTIGYLFVNPGDKIILTDKFWGNYRLVFEHGYGGVLDVFNTFNEGGFDTESLEKKLREEGRKKIVLLNFPNNPTGYTPTNEEAKEVIKIIKESAERGNEILVVCDDAYFGLAYKEGIYRESFFSALADLHENVLAVKVDGNTKEDYVWGLRVGFVTFGFKEGNEEIYTVLEHKAAGAIRGNLSSVSHLSQSLVLAGLTSPEYEKEKREKYDLLKARFEKVKEVLEEEKDKGCFSPLPFNSGYFMCVELREGLDAEKIRQTLLIEYDTGVIAIGNLLRVAFSSIGVENIKQLFENIDGACKTGGVLND